MVRHCIYHKNHIKQKTLKLVPVLIGNTPNVIRHKNDIIARAIEDILLSGIDTTKIRDQVTAILTKFVLLL